MSDILFQIMIYLLAAVAAVPLAARLGAGSVLGYLFAGIVIGFIPSIGSDAEKLQSVAEFGVVMMLFIIGLDMEPRSLWEMRNRLLGLGGAQIGLTMLAVFTVLWLVGLQWQTALVIGAVLALSSTAIVLQTLSEKGLIQTGGGRSVFAVLLAQDIAVIPFLSLVPLFALPVSTIDAPSGARLHPEVSEGGGHHEAPAFLLEGLPGWGITLVTVGAIAAIVLVGAFLTRPVFQYIQHARLHEIYTALSLLIVTSIAVLMHSVGLSPALGAFLAGVVLANSEFRHQLENDLAPFKGLLLGLFFITVGASIDFFLIAEKPALIFGAVLGLIAIKGAILYGLGRVFRLQGRDRWLFALSLTQAGEFGFVLVAFAAQVQALPGEYEALLFIVIALSMITTPMLFLMFERLSVRGGQEGPLPESEEIDERDKVIIAGIGRFGQVANRLLRSAGFEPVILDGDYRAVKNMRSFGFKGYFGDPNRPDILRAAGIQTAHVLIVCLKNRDDATRLVKHARKVRPDIHIVARARDRHHVYELNQAGANDTVREMFDSSLRAGRYALENLGLTEYEAHVAETVFYEEDRAILRELSPLWQSGVAPSDNPEYMRKARELNENFENIARDKRAQQEMSDLFDVSEGIPPKPDVERRNGDHEATSH